MKIANHIHEQSVTNHSSSRNPTPGRIFDAWKTYTGDRKYIKVLSTNSENIGFEGKYNAIEKNLIELEYHLGPESEDGPNNNKSNSYSPASYLDDGPNLQYYSQLMHTYSFWRRFLVRIVKEAQLQEKTTNIRHAKEDETELAEFEGVNQKFKHAFFSMLTLTCLLLAILLICVYLLKKNSASFPPRDDTRSGYL